VPGFEVIMVQTAIQTGIAELDLRPGDHVCAFYRSAVERDDLLMPFLRTGLQSGDKCVCVVDSEQTAARVRSMQQLPADGQLDVHLSDTTYLTGGRFTPEHMLSFWTDHVTAAINTEGYTFTRLVGEMTWALRDMPGVEHLLWYEAQLNRAATLYPQVLLCLYDLDQFDGEVVVDIVKTHPKVFINGMIVENPYYVEPDDFVGATPS
jgi:hypothetical protein